MCFSSSASFAAAAVLLPVGAAAVHHCREGPRSDLLPLALTPLLFSLQQALEGVVWLPWCVLRINRDAPDRLRHWLLRLLLLGLGLLGGIWLWLPLLVDGSRLRPDVVHGSLAYGTTPLAEGWISLGLGSTAYALVITARLLLSASGRLRAFAAAILAGFLVAHLGYGHAFTSVWCHFSALLSSSLFWILREPAPQTPSAAVAGV